MRRIEVLSYPEYTKGIGIWKRKTAEHKTQRPFQGLGGIPGRNRTANDALGEHTEIKYFQRLQPFVSHHVSQAAVFCPFGPRNFSSDLRHQAAFLCPRENRYWL